VRRCGRLPHLGRLDAVLLAFSLTPGRQAAWARELQATLQRAGGCIERRAEAYAAAKAMVATLGDRYTEFLTPWQASARACTRACMRLLDD
jgi:truncated hemoglobin YjbI